MVKANLLVELLHRKITSHWGSRMPEVYEKKKVFQPKRGGSRTSRGNRGGLPVTVNISAALPRVGKRRVS